VLQGTLDEGWCERRTTFLIEAQDLLLLRHQTGLFCGWAGGVFQYCSVVNTLAV
jgi:hypothetical protein